MKKTITYLEACRLIEQGIAVEQRWAIVWTASIEPPIHNIGCGLDHWTTREAVEDACEVYFKNTGLPHVPVLTRVRIGNGSWLHLERPRGTWKVRRWKWWPFYKTIQLDWQYEQHAKN